MLFLDKIKNLELEISIAREQINRSASSKLKHMLSIQKSPQTKLVQILKIASLYLKLIPQTLFLLLNPPRVRLSNQYRLQHLLGRLMFFLKSLILRILLFLRINCMIDLYGLVIFVERLDIFVQTVSSYKLHKILWYLLVSW